MKKVLDFIRICACKPLVRPADVAYNVQSICELAKDVSACEVSVAVMPELSITGYSCADLFEMDHLLDSAYKGLKILLETEKREFPDTALIIGMPLTYQGRLYNCAVVTRGGKIYGVVPKSYLPNYGEFYEKRWFASGRNVRTCYIDIPECNAVNVPFGVDLMFEVYGAKFGIEICEDLWVATPPCNSLSTHGAEIIFNLSATNELIGKHAYLLDLVRGQSARCRCAYAYSSAGLGESSTDLAFSGNCIIAENGTLLCESRRFDLGPQYEVADIDLGAIRHDRRKFQTLCENADENMTYRVVNITNESEYAPTYRIDSFNPIEYRYVNPHPFVDSDPEALRLRCDEISSIQAWGLLTRLRAIHCSKAVIGISGGLDSTLALLVTVKAFDMLGLDRHGIIAITMPGFGTTHRTHSNADRLMDLLGVTKLEIPIADAVSLHFRDINQDPEKHDITYENSQARERTQILMDIANKENAIVIGTGDLSELALGWCTYNGDQMSMYGVNTSIPKTLVRYLVDGYAQNTDNEELRKILIDICNTPVSPELLPADSKGNIAQKTEDVVGPYELHDFFMYHMLRYGADKEKILMLAKKAFDGMYDAETIEKWLDTFVRRFYSQQFKRSCMPDGVKVGSICLSPRGDWRMPSDVSYKQLK